MESRKVRNVISVIAVGVVGIYSAFSQSGQSSAATSPEASAKPMILEKNEGELRTRRIHTDASIPASSQFMLKVSPKNNGSQHLVAGTEELAPGAAIKKHKHLDQDEILLVQTGKAHVSLGDQFIPSNTWISLKNVGDEPIQLTFIFSAPGFEDTMRCNSVPAGETPTPITPAEQKECAHLGHSEY